MGQAEYSAFKERMKQWMLENADIYDEFEEMMNSQSDVGYQQIMSQAILENPALVDPVRQVKLTP